MSIERIIPNPKVNVARIRGELGYDSKYDCYYNTRTGEWLESACKGKGCQYCHGRPPKHISDTTTKKKNKKK